MKEYEIGIALDIEQKDRRFAISRMFGKTYGNTVFAMITDWEENETAYIFNNRVSQEQWTIRKTYIVAFHIVKELDELERYPMGRPR